MADPEKVLVIIMTIPPVILEISAFPPLKEENETPLKTDFTEYLWMEHEEEFEEEVMKQLEEEALMDECMEAMLEDEMMMMELDCVEDATTGLYGSVVEMSMLNPDADEFIPRTLS